MTGRAGGTGPGSRETRPPGTCSPAPPADTEPPAEAHAQADPGPIRRVVRVINPLGLHHRVADRFSRTANQFACTVTVWNGEARADGKSLWDLIMLVVMPNSEIVLEVAGPDAHKAVDPLAAVLASPGGEDYTI